MRQRTTKNRAGFTLIELLVVISLIALLAIIGAAYIPAAMDAQRASIAGTQVQGALQIARQRALLDRAPRGVRLTPDPTNLSRIITLQYIQQPYDFNQVGSTVQSISATQMQFGPSGAVDLTNGSADPTQWSALPGDHIQLQGTGMVHQISPAAGSVTTNTVTLTSPLTTLISSPTSNYRVIRQPRILGDDPVTLPANAGIDLMTDTATAGGAAPYHFNGDGSLPAANPDGTIDILFSPAGDVLGYTKTSNRIVLWVRDYNYPTPFEGEPTLVAAFVRSGLIAAYPVDSSNATKGTPTPYDLVK